MTEFVVLRTGKLHQLEMADLALDEAGVPHYLQEESVSGIRTAMPVDPSSGPGTWWSILVPPERIDEARSVVDALPFEYTTHPDVWDCEPAPRGKLVIRIAIWIFLAYLLAMTVAVLLWR